MLISPLSVSGISLDLKVLREPAILTATMTELTSEVGNGRMTTKRISVNEHNLCGIGINTFASFLILKSIINCITTLLFYFHLSIVTVNWESLKRISNALISNPENKEK